MNCDLFIKDILSIINQKKCENTSVFDILTTLFNYILIISVIILNIYYLNLQKKQSKLIQSIQNNIENYKIGLVHTEDALELFENITHLSNRNPKVPSNYAQVKTFRPEIYEQRI